MTRDHRQLSGINRSRLGHTAHVRESDPQTTGEEREQHLSFASSPNRKESHMTYVKGHRRNGFWVRPHYRSRPGRSSSSRWPFIIVLLLLLAWVASGTPLSGGYDLCRAVRQVRHLVVQTKTHGHSDRNPCADLAG